MIKTSFSRSLPEVSERVEHRRASLIHKRETGIWQRRYWEHTIRDEADYAAHMDYIHFNPVKHGFAVSAADWPFSSFSRCVARGMYPADWAVRDVDVADAGERSQC